MTDPTEHSREEAARTLHRAFNDRDREAFLACLVDDVTWHVEGQHPMAGTYHGREDLWDGYFGPMWQSPARWEDHEVRDHGDHVVALGEVFHNFGEGERGWRTVEVLTLRDGRVAERRAFTSGQPELDRFISRGCAADPEAAGPEASETAVP
ncbi:MAG TPA: nuclear transport factor 2 family protein [Egibacteraceae bacterium]|nr:nuclear transport factor 2 family protein [Egibacteraceae bacterium]